MDTTTVYVLATTMCGNGAVWPRAAHHARQREEREAREARQHEARQRDEDYDQDEYRQQVDYMYAQRYIMA